MRILKAEDKSNKMIQVFPASKPMLTKHKQKLPKGDTVPLLHSLQSEYLSSFIPFQRTGSLTDWMKPFLHCNHGSSPRNLESDGTTEALQSGYNTMQTSPSTPGQVSAQCADCLLVQTAIDSLLHSLKIPVSLARSKCTQKEIQNI